LEEHDLAVKAGGAGSAELARLA
jgi:hypothetical protein